MIDKEMSDLYLPPSGENRSESSECRQNRPSKLSICESNEDSQYNIFSKNTSMVTEEQKSVPQ